MQSQHTCSLAQENRPSVTVGLSPENAMRATLGKLVTRLPPVLALAPVELLGNSKGAHFHGRPAGDDRLAPPRQCLFQIGGFHHPKTADVLLGLQVWPIGDKNLAIGLRA